MASTVNFTGAVDRDLLKRANDLITYFEKHNVLTTKCGACVLAPLMARHWLRLPFVAFAKLV